jgi:hypothetical protein
MDPILHVDNVKISVVIFCWRVRYLVATKKRAKNNKVKNLVLVKVVFIYSIEFVFLRCTTKKKKINAERNY